MTTRSALVGVALSAALLIGGGTTIAAPGDGSPMNCVGQHVSMMARDHGGMAAATAHHNAMHGTNLSVGEHQTHVRTEMCDR
jgi:hypothetical protein